MDKIDLKEYSWIMRGRQRKIVIKEMNCNKLTPTQIKNKTNLALNNVSDILRLFVKRNLAECLNEKEKTGRLYRLTKEGDKIRKEILRNNW